MHVEIVSVLPGAHVVGNRAVVLGPHAPVDHLDGDVHERGRGCLVYERVVRDPQGLTAAPTGYESCPKPYRPVEGGAQALDVVHHADEAACDLLVTLSLRP